MTDLYLFGIVAGVVAVVAFVLYVWDKTSKGQPIEWLDAGKLALGSGGVAVGGCPTAIGMVLHTFVFFVALVGLMMLPKDKVE